MTEKFSFVHPFSVGIFGIPGSGKSHLLKYLMYNTRKLFNLVIVITGTKYNGFFDFVNKDFVHEYSDELINRILEITTKWKAQKKDFKTLVVFDDVLGTTINITISVTLLSLNT